MEIDLTTGAGERQKVLRWSRGSGTSRALSHFRIFAVIPGFFS